MAHVTEQSWVNVQTVTGGHQVLCGLCGVKRSKRRFMAADTNYAEALRRAAAYAWQHEHDPAHVASVAAYHAADPEPNEQDLLMVRVFGAPLPSKSELKRRAGRAAAEAVNPRRRKRGAH